MLNKIFATMVGVLLANAAWAGPYSPAAGKPGSSAISKDDAGIVQWATGYSDYNPGANVWDTWKTPEKALGKAVGDSYDIVSLGDKGTITLTFSGAIFDGDGYDFAIFENSFSDTFLELAFVEVSSNGADFFRFTNNSLTARPVTAFGSVDPTNIDGLAGKHRQGYGTPFDLASLAGVSSLLDIGNVQYIRLIDIAGDGTEFDSAGRKIYDPYQTAQSGGFDLDAIGVMNFRAVTPVPEPTAAAMLGLGLVVLPVIARRRTRRSAA